mmetsp:Transcript_9098/g.9456  ORF Transcript_9098/g.9456 Transcript_9098/m.9456 type:complete len:398 (+) Transcript_9098:22-1215(+)
MVESKPTLFGYKHSTNLLKIVAAAKVANFDLNVTAVDNVIKPKDVVEESPSNTYPYLVTSNGIIAESSAILTYIGAQSGLSGANDVERAQVVSWLFFSAYEVNTNKRNTVYPIFGFVAQEDKAHKEELDRLKNNLKALNKHLAGKKYLLGEKYSVADIDLWSNLKHLWQLVYVEQVRKNLFANIDAWFQRVANHPEILGTWGPTLLCKAVQKAVTHHKEEKKEVKKEEKKEEKKVEENKPQAFPESAINFDQVKNEFYNASDKNAALEKLLAEFDHNAFSIYYIRYQKLETEGKELWLTENGRGFFLQKLDPFRKHVMANFGIYGVEGDYEIKGVWMWRGVGIPFFMNDNESFEYYDKKVLDPRKEEDKKIIQAYWLSNTEGDIVEGLPLVSNESFK